VCELEITNQEEYRFLIPDILQEEFTSKDFKKASGLPLGQAQTALNILHFVGAVDRIGKKGNSYIYIRTNPAERQP
jgi:hypothetical protein